MADKGIEDGDQAAVQVAAPIDDATWAAVELLAGPRHVNSWVVAQCQREVSSRLPELLTLARDQHDQWTQYGQDLDRVRELFEGDDIASALVAWTDSPTDRLRAAAAREPSTRSAGKRRNVRLPSEVAGDLTLLPREPGGEQAALPQKVAHIVTRAVAAEGPALADRLEDRATRQRSEADRNLQLARAIRGRRPAGEFSRRP